MENISIKLESAVARQIERDMKEFRYSTKTEFIRDSIRAKLKENDAERAKKNAWKALFAARGIFKGKGKAKTEEEWYKWRMEYGEKLAEELAKKYNLKI
jgi:Arc/MetJ-type ribon-helix-helix transcriptional regulator